MKLELPSIVLIVVALVVAFWVNSSRQRLTLRKVDRQIFDGEGI